MGKRKKEDDTFLRKKNSRKKKFYVNDICPIFQVKLKLQGESFE